MAMDYGKAFEQKFRECFKKSFPQGFIYRLPDQMSGYASYSSNACDFLTYNYPQLMMIECKSTENASFSFSALRQYDKLKDYVYIPGVRAGVVIWLIKKDVVFYVPILTVKKMKENGLKSINPKTLDRKKYYIVDIPSVKLRTFMDSDYRVLMNIKSDEEIDKYENIEE